MLGADRPLASRVREIRTHGLRGGLRKRGRKAATAPLEPLQRVHNAGIDLGFIGNMFTVVVEKPGKQRVKLVFRGRAAVRCQSTGNQNTRPAPDQTAHIVQRNRCDTDAAQCRIQRMGEVRRAVDQRAVKIKQDCRCSHDAPSTDCQEHRQQMY